MSSICPRTSTLFLSTHKCAIQSALHAKHKIAHNDLPIYTILSVYFSIINHQGRCLERSAVDEASEELEGLAGGGLRHLVATALHCHKSERALALGGHVVVGGIAGDLVLHSLGRGVGPVVPRILHRVAHALSPGLSVGVRHAGIPVAVEDHHADRAHQLGVSVRRQVGASAGVLPSGGGVADSPAESRVTHVDGLHHLGSVQVARSHARVNAGGRAVGDDALQTSLVRLGLDGGDGGVLNDILRSLGHLATHRSGQHLVLALALIVHAVAIDVVQVDVGDLRGGLVKKLDAVERERILLVLGGRLPVASLVHFVLQVRGHERGLQQVLPLVVGALGSGAADANLGTGAAVSDRNAGQRSTSVGASLLRVDDGLRKGRHIHTGVRLTGDEELVLGELREHAEEGLDSGEVLGGSAVVVALVIASLGVTETNTDGGLNVEHVHLAVPAVLSESEGLEILGHDERAVLVDKTIQR
mmetsp:Transcript_19929/g.34539  ORF Transcript_19929/g.34539 Transcript_19929/m.34539 type:complete len:473 (+) Transcript_19929:107-1525(+)